MIQQLSSRHFGVYVCPVGTEVGECDPVLKLYTDTELRSSCNIGLKLSMLRWAGYGYPEGAFEIYPLNKMWFMVVKQHTPTNTA